MVQNLKLKRQELLSEDVLQEVKNVLRAVAEAYLFKTKFVQIFKMVLLATFYSSIPNVDVLKQIARA